MCLLGVVTWAACAVWYQMSVWVAQPVCAGDGEVQRGAHLEGGKSGKWRKQREDKRMRMSQRAAFEGKRLKCLSQRSAQSCTCPMPISEPSTRAPGLFTIL